MPTPDLTTARADKISAYIRDDAFAKWLGATIEVIEPGYSRVSLQVEEDMTNFHGTTHGGVIFSIADMAFAAACNSRGQTSVALNVNVSFLRATPAGVRLVAEAREQHQDGPIALYDLTVHTEPSNELVAKCQAMAYRRKDWFVPEENDSQ